MPYSLGLTKAGKVLTGADTKILKARQAVRDAEIVSNKARIDSIGVGKPSESYMDRNIRTPNERQSNYTKKMGYEPYTPTDELPTISADEGKVTLPKIDKTTGKPIEAPKTPLNETAPKSNLTQQGEISTPEIEQSKVDTTTPKESPHLSSIEDSLGKQDNISRQTNPELRLGDLKTRSARIDKLHTEDPSTLERIAMGLETHPEISQEDALGGLSRIATDTGDARLIDKLTESNVGSQAASNFNGLKLAGENNIVKVIRDLKLSIEKKFPNTFKKSKIETDEAFSKINKYMKENNIPDNEFNNIMDNFVCK